MVEKKFKKNLQNTLYQSKNNHIYLKEKILEMFRIFLSIFQKRVTTKFRNFFYVVKENSKKIYKITSYKPKDTSNISVSSSKYLIGNHF